MGAMEAHVDKMEAQLSQWSARLDMLVARAQEPSADAKIDYHTPIHHLTATEAAARAKLDALKASGSENWEALKAGVESAWAELEATFKKLTA